MECPPILTLKKDFERDLCMAETGGLLFVSYSIGPILKEKNSLRLFNMCFLTHGTCQILKQFHFIKK